MKYRLGIDLGTNSLGWAAVQLLEPEGGAYSAGPLIDMGVRIFSDARSPKDKSSNAAQRRGPRGARRNRDRKLSRGRAVMHVLADIGLLPAGEQDRLALRDQDPWILRGRALDERLDPHDLGRAIYHLQKRRGFKSNRKTDGADDGAMYAAIQAAREKMRSSGARTLGELFGTPRLAQLRDNKAKAYGARAPLPQARVKARTVGAKMAYDYYPDRAMILDEFEQIWAAQKAHHPALLTDDAHERLFQAIAHQRPLKAQPVGKCTFLEGEPRAPTALPSSQYERILQEVNNLYVGAIGETAQPLTQDRREKLIAFLARPSNQTGKRTFKSIRKELNIPESSKFNLESAKRDHLMGDITAARMMQETAWGPAWLDLDRSAQDEVIGNLLGAEVHADFVPWVMRVHGLEEARAKRVFDVRLPDGHGRLSKKALDRLIPRMERGERYDQACTAEFRDHRATGDGVVYDQGLPYYGEVLSRHTAFSRANPSNEEERHGRVANPTVHVALNELRKVINDLISRWGAPEQVVLELARDLPLSDRGLKELEQLQTKNQKENEKRAAELLKMGVADNYDNRLKLRLYEEALEAFGGTAVCVFSGATLNMAEVFSPNVEIEHVLPLSRTLDDGFSNKVLALREANRIKGNKSPYEAFGGSPQGYSWEQIGQRAARFPYGKAWRFNEDAMQRWEERGGDFLARQLNDTRYIARLGKHFVEAIYGGQGLDGQNRNVWVVPGRLTADLRHHAGFNTLTGLTGGNRKDRTDHRHHAVDALVVALTDHAMVKRAADLAQSDAKAEHEDMMAAMAAPLKRYRRPAEDRLGKLVVSHKPDHGFQGAMHNDTAYGITGLKAPRDQIVLVTRKPLESFKKSSDLEAIVDPVIRRVLMEQTESLSGKAFEEALLSAGEGMRPPVRKVRVHEVMPPTSFVSIAHGRHGQHVKAYKGDSNYCYDIFADAKGRWTGQVITTFQAYQFAQGNQDWWRASVRPDGSPLIMRLRKGDMLEIDRPGGGRRAVTVFKFTKGTIDMAEHHEANASSRIRSKELEATRMAPSALQKANAVILKVSPAGRVRRLKA